MALWQPGDRMACYALMNWTSGQIQLLQCVQELASIQQHRTKHAHKENHENNHKLNHLYNHHQKNRMQLSRAKPIQLVSLYYYC